MNFLLDDPKVDFEVLKYKALVISGNSKVSMETSRKVRDLILNDEISRKEFILEFNNAMRDYQTKHWKTLLILKSVKNAVYEINTLIPWKKVSVIVVSVGLTIFIIKKVKLKKQTKKRIKKILKKVYSILFNIIERLGALAAYSVPLISIYAAYMPGLVSTFPYLHFILPDSMQDAMDFYIKHPRLFNYGYFFITLYAVTLFKIPKPRFIRFHLLRGLMLLAFQGIPDSLFKAFQSADTLTQAQIVNTTLSLFAINLSWILPCLYQAVTHTYPRSSFIRDAVEINLGRDKDEGFKWWDRK